MVSGFLALLVATSTAAGPLPQATTPAPMRYRFDVTISQSVDATAAGQGMQEGQLDASVYATLTTADTTDGQTAHVVIDSMTLTPSGILTAAFNQSLADSLRGESIDAYIKDGKVEGTPVLSVPDNQAMGLASSILNALFPGIGAKAQSADTFADTVQSNNTSEQGSRNTQQVITWTVSGRDGAVLTLTGSGTGTLTSDMGQRQMNGTTTMTLKATSPVGGPSESAAIESDQQITMMIEGLSDPIPIKVTTHATLASLP